MCVKVTRKLCEDSKQWRSWGAQFSVWNWEFCHLGFPFLRQGSSSSAVGKTTLYSRTKGCEHSLWGLLCCNQQNRGRAKQMPSLVQVQVGSFGKEKLGSSGCSDTVACPTPPCKQSGWKASLKEKSYFLISPPTWLPWLYVNITLFFWPKE